MFVLKSIYVVIYEGLEITADDLQNKVRAMDKKQKQKNAVATESPPQDMRRAAQYATTARDQR
jgi:hypothetical protein